MGENPAGVFVSSSRRPGPCRDAVTSVLAGSRINGRGAPAKAMPQPLWPGLVPAGPPVRVPGRAPPCIGPGPARRVHLADWPAHHPSAARGTERRSGKVREKLLAPSGTTTPNCAGACLGRLEEGHGMDSVTRGSGIVLSVLIAATASILLLLPGKPAGSWPGPGTPGHVVMASAVATSTWGTLGSQPPPAPDAARRRPGHAPGAGPRARTAAGPGRAWPPSGPAGPARGRSGPGSCRRRGALRDQDMSRR